MKISTFYCRALSSCVAAAMLAGCSVTPSGVEGLSKDQDDMRPVTGTAGSWMLPGATHQDLLYAGGIEPVNVYSYPSGKMVGSLGDFDGPDGMCIDRAGHVFITIYYDAEILEYAHGGSTPIATISTDNFPADCSVDPTTGNLAVTFYDGIEIFPDGASGWGIGQTYTQPDGTYFTFSCAYDTSGNLFFDSDTHTSSFQLTELLVGSRSFVTIALSRGFDIAGGLFWDGKYLAVADVRRHGRRHQKLLPTIVYRFAIQGDYGTEVSATKLRKGDGGRFWIQGPVLLSGAGDSVGFWRYPRGGQPRKVLQIPDGFSGLAVSPGT